MGLGGRKLFTWNRGLWDNSPWHRGSCGGPGGLGLKSFSGAVTALKVLQRHRLLFLYAVCLSRTETRANTPHTLFVTPKYLSSLHFFFAKGFKCSSLFKLNPSDNFSHSFLLFFPNCKKKDDSLCFEIYDLHLRYTRLKGFSLQHSHVMST